MSYVLVLPNKFGKYKNLVITHDSYFKTFTDSSKKADLAQIGLNKEIIW